MDSAGHIKSFISARRATDAVDRFILPIYKKRYAACSKARGLVNKLPLGQRSKHYAKIASTQNRLRAIIARKEDS